MPKNPFPKKTHPNCHEGHEYACDIVSGKIPVCKFTVGACKRYLSNIENTKNKKDFAYRFDKDKAEHYLRTVQKFHHAIGKWDTETLVFEPWQKFCWMEIMGWYSLETGYRKYRIAHIEIPRGNGKSPMASQAALYFLAFDDPVGNQIDCFATKKDQARIVLDSARAMALKNKSFLKAKGVEVLAHKIVCEKTFSEVKALSSDQNSLDGLNAILAILDELHAMKKEVFDVVYSGMSKRKDNLMLCITTAGFNTHSAGFSQSEYAKKVALGEVNDEQFYSLIYTIDEQTEDYEGDNVFDLQIAKKANPNYGVSVDPTTLEAKIKRAEYVPSDLVNLKVKHFNIWLNEGRSFFSQQKWDQCADTSLKEEDFKNEKCYMGLDLASQIDLTSNAKVFRSVNKEGQYIYTIFDRSYIPSETFDEQNNTLFHQCVSDGHLVKTPGEAIHYPEIEQDVINDKSLFSVAAAHFDPWNATQLAQGCKKSGVNMVEFRMNTANLSEPTKALDACIRQGRVVHNGSPLLRWCLGNVVCKEDNAGNVFPKKNHKDLKIDPIIAIIMAFAGWVQEEQSESVYESRGIRIL